MNSFTSISRGYCENDYEFCNYLKIPRTSYLRTHHDGLHESVFLKDANVRKRKLSPFDYSINIIDL